MSIIEKVIPYGLIKLWNTYVVYPHQLRKMAKGVQIVPPVNISKDDVNLEDFTRIQPNVVVITSEAKLTLKKYASIGAGCLIIPGAHVPTVGLPQFLSTTHINDVQRGITINEDCWIGAESALLSKCNIGRGAIVAARSVITKDVLPYSVVAGTPAKNIATRFTLEQVIEHERTLYPPEERLSEDYLRELFETKYKGLKAIGTSEMSESDHITLKEAKKSFGIYPYNL